MKYLRTLTILVLSAGAVGCDRSPLTTAEAQPSESSRDSEPEHPDRWADPPVGESVELSASEWRERLGPEEYRVLRQQGTERAFTGRWDDHHGDGVYRCAGCGAPLFDSEHKFDSGTGWPSFDRPLPGRVDTERDASLGMVRTEVHCARCDGHLGHVFPDGPPTTGKRYCINSISLDFDPEE